MSTTADIVATFCLMNDARNENKFHYWELLPNKSKTICLVVWAYVEALLSGTLTAY